MRLFTIIVPVYNVEKYINRCIDSILAQTINEWELILVDDGSLDNSGKICDEYAEKDTRIKVFHKQNGGVSSARNLGIQEAEGEFVLFVDADDYLEKYALSVLKDATTGQNPDMVIYNTREVLNNGKQIEYHYPLLKNKVYNKQEIEQQLIPFACQSPSFVNPPWNKAYRLTIIRDNNLCFQKRVMGEDWLFNVNYIQKINSAIFIDKPLYNYMRNDESASSKYIPEHFQLWCENWKVKMCLIDKYHLTVDINKMKRDFYHKTFYFIRDIKTHEPKKNIIQKINIIKNNSIFKESLRALPTNLRELRAWLVLSFRNRI